MSDAEPSTALEARIAAALDAGDLEAAARLTIEGYGGELLGFLVAIQRDEANAREVFAQFSEDLWRGIAGFRRASSMRTWCYKLARNALHRFRRDPFRRYVRPLASEEYSGLVARVTSQLGREQARGRLEVARAVLDEDDQQLLVLRIDRKLPWDEIAQVMAEDDRAMDPAVLRKRFERIKQRLRKAVADA